MTDHAINEARWSGEFLVSEAHGTRARDQVTLIQQTYVAPQVYTLGGTVLGQITTGAQTVGAAAAFAGNATNDTVSAPTAGASAPAGTYKVVGISTGATGEFEVYLPSGVLDGVGKVGTAYTGTIGFTITDGSTHLAVGDGWNIAVSYAAGSGKYTPLNLSAIDGSQTPVAILFNTLDASLGDVKATVINRACEVNGSELTYPSGATANQIATINTALKALGIIVR